MTEDSKLIISSSPHILSNESTKDIMWTVNIFLLPATIFGIFAFGLNAALVVIVSIVSSVFTEWVLIKWMKKRQTIDDGSAVLTGLIIALNMPPNIPLFIPVLSSIFAVAIVKQAFGGLGQNWANPGIAARIFALFSWTQAMTTWHTPFLADTITTATPLGAVKTGLADAARSGAVYNGPMDLLQSLSSDIFRTPVSYQDFFFGFKGGCIGEVSIFLLIIPAIYLIYRKIITLDIPVFFIGTVALLTWIFDGLRFAQPLFTGDPLFHLLTGGLIFGALFCATDMVTTPITTTGRVIFGIGAGLITVLIRLSGSLPEGVSLAILFMNMLTPTIDRFIKVKPMGLNTN